MRLHSFYELHGFAAHETIGVETIILHPMKLKLSSSKWSSTRIFKLKNCKFSFYPMTLLLMVIFHTDAAIHIGPISGVKPTLDQNEIKSSVIVKFSNYMK